MRPVALLFVLAGASVAACLSACSTAARDEAPIRPAIVARPTALAPTPAESYAGEVRARVESRLGFRIAGKIKRRHVDIGSTVRAGDVIAELDASDLVLAVGAAEAALASAEADAELARAELERHRELRERRYISEALYEARRSAAEAAAARVRQARAQLAQARNQVDYATLRADADGVITALGAEVGQVVAAGMPVATLAHAGAIEVLIAVPESRIDRFAPGQTVVVEVWAREDARFDGRVREIAPEADPRTRTFDVRVSLDEPSAIALGMTARVHVGHAEAPRALLLPLSALHRRGEQPAVWQVDPVSGRVRLTPVDVLAYREDGVVLGAGLDPAGWYVVAGVHKLVDGQTVRPVGRDNRPVGATGDAVHGAG